MYIARLPDSMGCCRADGIECEARMCWPLQLISPIFRKHGQQKQYVNRHISLLENGQIAAYCRASTGTVTRAPKIGVLGGGQLGKMLAMEAVSLTSRLQNAHKTFRTTGSCRRVDIRCLTRATDACSGQAGGQDCGFRPHSRVPCFSSGCSSGGELP